MQGSNFGECRKMSFLGIFGGFCGKIGLKDENSSYWVHFQVR